MIGSRPDGARHERVPLDGESVLAGVASRGIVVGELGLDSPSLAGDRSAGHQQRGDRRATIVQSGAMARQSESDIGTDLEPRR